MVALEVKNLPVRSASLSDISSLELVDSFIGRMLANTSAMAYVLGAQALAVGMQGKSSRREACCALWLFVDERSHVSGEGVGGVISTLRRFRQPQNVQERCELCGVGLSRNHRHLLEISQSQIVCACDPWSAPHDTVQALAGPRWTGTTLPTWSLPRAHIRSHRHRGLVHLQDTSARLAQWYLC